MWRPSTPADDAAVVGLCLGLNREDPGPRPVTASQVRRTLRALRAAPLRGRAVVLERNGQVVGYALLIAFWSNELGGETCVVDELYVVPELRGRGLGARLFQDIDRRRSIWPRRPVAVSLEVSPRNARARAFYARLGFRRTNSAWVRRRG
jgi:GNAT superfamily N-acetyltransferase